jgi:hypothetical protein
MGKARRLHSLLLDNLDGFVRVGPFKTDTDGRLTPLVSSEDFRGLDDGYVHLYVDQRLRRRDIVDRFACS